MSESTPSPDSPPFRDPGDIASAVKKGKGGPDSWNPPFCGDIDMRIARDGTWFYMGTPIGRMPLVKLFAGVLRLEDGKYFLVTPVEKIGITVDDAPFTAIDVQQDGGDLVFTTNVGDEVRAAPGNDIFLRFNDEDGEPAPYIHIRKGLNALITRSMYYHLISWAEERDVPGDRGQKELVIGSGSAEYSLGSWDGDD